MRSQSARGGAGKRKVTVMHEDVIIDLTYPNPGTLGYRIRQIEGAHEPAPGTLGHRLSGGPSARHRLPRTTRRLARLRPRESVSSP